MASYVLQKRTSATAFAPAGDWANTTVQPAAAAAGPPATPAATMAEETGLDPGTSYDFRVRAVAGPTAPDGTTIAPAPDGGPWSVVASGVATNVPGSVTNLTVLAENDGSLTLAWTPAASMGSKVTSYTVSYQRATPDTDYNPWRSHSVAASPLPSTTITGLTNSETYVISVVARNAVGASSIPITTTGTPQAGGGSFAAPTSITTTVVPTTVSFTDGTLGAGSRISVKWNAVSRATHYSVEYLKAIDAPSTLGNPADDTAWVAVAGSVATPIRATSATINLTDAADVGDTIVVRVRAVTAAGAAVGRYGFSSAVKAQAAPATPPTNVDAVQIAGTTTVRVDWTSLSAFYAASQRVTKYQVSWGPTNPQVTGNRGSATVAAPANAGEGLPMSYNITGLNAIGQTIRVTVQAVNNVGPGGERHSQLPE